MGDGGSPITPWSTAIKAPEKKMELAVYIQRTKNLEVTSMEEKFNISIDLLLSRVEGLSADLGTQI